MTHLYDRRRSFLVTGLHGEFADELSVVPAVAGLHMRALTRSNIDIDGWLARARLNEVDVRCLQRFATARTKLRGLVFGYGAIDEGAIGQALARLAAALKS